MTPGITRWQIPLNSLVIFVMRGAVRCRFIHKAIIRNEDVDSSILFSSTNKPPEVNNFRRFSCGLRWQ